MLAACLGLRGRLYSRSEGQVEPAQGDAPRDGPGYGAAASIAFTIRLSETGYAVPSACAK
jgi:hypothetical protein